MPNTVLGKVSLTPMGAYNAETAYTALDLVGYNGGGYIALQNVQGVTPVNDGINWMLLAAPGESIGSVERTSGTGVPGTTDTYTVKLADGSVAGTFQVYNGADGSGAGDFKADGTVPMTGNLQMGGNRITGLGSAQDDADAVNKSDLEAAISSVTVTTDATPTEESVNPVQSGGVYTALSNKAEWNSGFLQSGSILDWAEGQKINTHVATNSGVTGFPYESAWAVDFYLYPSGGWRRLIATDIQLGNSYYCIKNATLPWSAWEPIATATPPQEYDLPLADGWTVILGHAATYSKNQFDQINIVLGLSTTELQMSEKPVFTVPVGFRPSRTITASVIFWSASTGPHPAVLSLSPDGRGILSHQVGTSESGNLHGAFTFISSGQ